MITIDHSANARDVQFPKALLVRLSLNRQTMTEAQLLDDGVTLFNNHTTFNTCHELTHPANGEGITHSQFQESGAGNRFPGVKGRHTRGDDAQIVAAFPDRIEFTRFIPFRNLAKAMTKTPMSRASICRYQNTALCVPFKMRCPSNWHDIVELDNPLGVANPRRQPKNDRRSKSF